MVGETEVIVVVVGMTTVVVEGCVEVDTPSVVVIVSVDACVVVTTLVAVVVVG